MSTRPLLRNVAVWLMLLGMLALVGHATAMAAGIDQCLDPDTHRVHQEMAAPDEASGNTAWHHSTAASGPCCIGACLVAIVAEGGELMGKPAHPFVPLLPAPSGHRPGGVERPPRA